MKAKLQAGAAIEFVTEREFREALEDVRRSFASLIRQHPTTQTINARGVVDANGVLVVDYGQPPIGFEWEVRLATINPQDPTSGVGGTGVILFVGSPSPTPQGGSDMPSTGLTGILRQTFSADQLVVGPTEHLYWWCGGLVAGTPHFASSRIIERAVTQEQTPIPIFAAG